jgi:hypothetical protein
MFYYKYVILNLCNSLLLRTPNIPILLYINEINEFIQKSSIILLFAIALLTGFMSVIYKQPANAFSIDLGQIPGMDGLQGLDLSKAHTADNGLQGLDPTKADKTDTADKSDTGLKNEHASPEQAEEFGHLNIMVDTIDLSGSSNPTRSSDFTIHVSGNHLSPK